MYVSKFILWLKYLQPTLYALNIFCIINQVVVMDIDLYQILYLQLMLVVKYHVQNNDQLMQNVSHSTLLK